MPPGLGLHRMDSRRPCRRRVASGRSGRLGATRSRLWFYKQESGEEDRRDDEQDARDDASTQARTWYSRVFR